MPIDIMRALQTPQLEGNLHELPSLGMVGNGLVEAIGAHTIIVDAADIDVADDHTLLMDEARCLL